MDSMRIEILNPKAKVLLKNLADMDLIKIKGENESLSFMNFLMKLRSKSDSALSLSEISKEVEVVRKSRYDD